MTKLPPNVGIEFNSYVLKGRLNAQRVIAQGGTLTTNEQKVSAFAAYQDQILNDEKITTGVQLAGLNHGFAREIGPLDPEALPVRVRKSALRVLRSIIQL